MIDYIVDEHGLTKEQAYVLSSVAVDLRIGQVVDVPNYVVTATLNLDVLINSDIIKNLQRGPYLGPL